jgi:2-amino-4-hydroxy-6-hydroxymethyldihydropteridine diphosphokinase
MKIFECYIALGANLKDRYTQIQRAKRLINVHIGSIIRESSLYNTAPWGELDQEDFLNQCILIHTSFAPDLLIKECQRIEKYLGKEKTSKYGPRSIDIDILLIDQMILNIEGLTVPHPKLHERNFVLIPLAEIAETVIHPVFHKTISQLKKACDDQGKVELYK